MANYPDNWVDDGRIWCYYDVSNTSSPITLISELSGITAMEIDGVDVPVTSSYQFSTTGEHLVKFTFTQLAYSSQFRRIGTRFKIYLPSSITTVPDALLEDAYAYEAIFAGEVTVVSRAAIKTAIPCLVRGVDWSKVTSIGSGGLDNAQFENTEVSFDSLTELYSAGWTDLCLAETNLTRVLSLGSVTNIPQSCFWRSRSLTEVVLPETLTSIQHGAFHDTSLSSLTCLATTPPSINGTIFPETNFIIKVPAASLSAYKQASGWSSYADRIFPIGDEKRLNINHMSLGDFRRRIMIGISRPKASPYPPDYVDDGKIWAYISVPEAGTYRISNGYGANIGWSALEIDGVNTGNTERDQYLSEGDHLLKYTLSNPAIYPPFSRGLSSYFTLIIVPGTVTTLSDYCFYGAQDTYTKVLMDKTKITYLGVGGLFHANINFGDVDFPNLQTLNTFFNDYYAAGNCKIKSLGEITSIPDGGFRGTVFKDNKYIIPATVTSIGNLCYYQNNNDLIYYCYPPTPPTLGGSQVWFRAPAAIYVPSASVDTYKAAEGWSNYANKIQAIPE